MSPDPALVAIKYGDVCVGTFLITIDYNINITNGTAWPCRCGAKRARATVA